MSSNIISEIITTGGTPAPTPVNHNDLSGIQGGSSGEYFHLTQNEYVVIMSMVEGNDILDVINGSGSTITKGAPVQIQSVNTGTNQITVEPYNGKTGLYIGLMAEDVIDLAVGMMAARAVISGINTSNLIAGEAFYLDASTLAFTPDKNISTFRIGVCLSVNASTGDVQVLPPTYTNEGQIVSWKGGFIGGSTYRQYDQTLDSGYLAIANKTTTDRPAPQENGLSSEELPDNPTWTDNLVAGQVVAGHQHTMTKSGFARILQQWTPITSDAVPYRIILLDITNPLIPVTKTLPIFQGGQNSWTEIGFENIFLNVGSVIQLLMISLNSAGISTWNGLWNYRGQNSETPVSGEWSRSQDGTEFLINKTDDILNDRTADLNAVIEGSTLVINNIGASTGSQSYLVLGKTDQGTYVEYSTTLLSSTGNFAGGDLCTIAAENPVTPAAEYVSIPDHWLGGGNDPEWATTKGVEYVNGSPVLNDNAYGIRMEFQPAVLSDDWDIISSPRSGSSSSNNDFTAASYRSITNQIPTVDLVSENIVFEVTVEETPQLTMNVDGSFTFNFNGQADANVSLSIARAGNGTIERIWFWVEKLTSTGPDVWTAGGTSAVRGTELNQLDTTIFPLPFTTVVDGDTYRVRMQAEDASELVGLYFEPAAGDRPLTASTTLFFKLYP